MKYNTASDNSAFGTDALYTNTTGGSNTSNGNGSLYNNTSGSSNSAFGYGAGLTNTLGNNNLYLGKEADASVNNLSNAIAIGATAIVSTSNTIQLGNTSITDVKTSGIISSTKGFLPPKITSVERAAITSPAAGLIVFCINCGVKGQMQYFDGTAWVDMVGNAAAGVYTPTVGSSYQGGKVAYILVSGDPGYDPAIIHGLIITNSDISGAAHWGCYGTSITTNNIFGSGLSNTNNIVAGCGESGTAAKICADLATGGFDDWYLPSIKEWEKIFPNSAAIGMSLINADYSIDPPKAIGNNGYWSSTQAQMGGGGGVASGEAKWMAYPQGDPNNTYNKSIGMRVRAIRAF